VKTLKANLGLEKSWHDFEQTLPSEIMCTVNVSLAGILDTRARAFHGSYSGTTRVSRYQKDKTNLDFTEARDSEWQ